MSQIQKQEPTLKQSVFDPIEDEEHELCLSEFKLDLKSLEFFTSVQYIIKDHEDEISKTLIESSQIFKHYLRNVNVPVGWLVFWLFFIMIGGFVLFLILLFVTFVVMVRENLLVDEGLFELVLTLIIIGIIILCLCCFVILFCFWMWKMQQAAKVHQECKNTIQNLLDHENSTHYHEIGLTLRLDYQNSTLLSNLFDRVKSQRYFDGVPSIRLFSLQYIIDSID